MAKRLCDTEIWNKDWYLELNLKQKLLVKFLFDSCDCAGFYQVSWTKLKFYFGEEIKREDFESIKQVKFIKENLIFIEDFVLFQYKLKSLDELNPNSSVHRGVLKRIEENKDYLTLTKPLPNPLERIKGYRLKDKGYNQSSNLEERKENLTKEKKENFLEPKLKIDPFTNPLIDDCFSLYKENCPNLLKLGFEPRNRQLREELTQFLQEIDCDIGYFKELCENANKLRLIANKPIDFKSMIRNHIGISNGKYVSETDFKIEELDFS